LILLESGRNIVFQSFLKAKNGLTSIFYPNLCEICSTELTVGKNHICHECLIKLNYTLFENYSIDTPIHEVFYGRINIELGYSLLFFKKDTATQDLLHRIKYTHGHGLAIEMGRLISQKLKSNTLFSSIDGVVPIPLHRKKEALRGYNQSLKLAEGVHAVSQIPIIHLVERKKHHESQTKKDRFDRWENVEQIFRVNKTIKPPKHIAIIDDVITTGSTLEAAYRVIKESYPEVKISIITLAFAK